MGTIKVDRNAPWRTYLVVDEAVIANHSDLFKSLLPKRGRPIKKNDKKCALCKKVLATIKWRIEHERMHTGISPYSCAICGEEKLFLSGITKHIKRHQNEVNDVSMTSSKQANKELIETLPITHEEEEESIIDIAGEMALEKKKCTICGETPEDLKRHYRLHTQLRLYRCRLCGEEFSFKKDVKVHVIEHSEEEKETYFFNLDGGEEPEIIDITDTRSPLRENNTKPMFLTPPTEIDQDTSDYKENIILRRFPKFEPEEFHGKTFDESFEAKKNLEISPSKDHRSSYIDGCSKECTCNFPIRTPTQVKMEEYDSFEQTPLISLAPPPSAMTPQSLNATVAELDNQSRMLVNEREQTGLSPSQTQTDVQMRIPELEKGKENTGDSSQTSSQENILQSPATRDLDQRIREALEYLARSAQKEKRTSLEKQPETSSNTVTVPLNTNIVNAVPPNENDQQRTETMGENSPPPVLTHYEKESSYRGINTNDSSAQPVAPPPPYTAVAPCYQPMPTMPGFQWCQTTNYNQPMLYNSNMSGYWQPMQPSPSMVNPQYLPTPPQQNSMMNYIPFNYYQPGGMTPVNGMNALGPFTPNFPSGNLSSNFIYAQQFKSTDNIGGQYPNHGFHPYKQI